MSVILYDDTEVWQRLFPFTFTRPIAEIRCGILTIKEKWEIVLGERCEYNPEPYLQPKFGNRSTGRHLVISGAIMPDAKLVKALRALKEKESLLQGEHFIGMRGNLRDAVIAKERDHTDEFLSIGHPWDIFLNNGNAIREDFKVLSKGRKSAKLSNTVTVIGDKSQLFLEKGAKAEACTINTTSGPVYIGAGAEVMEGAMIRGPVAICAHSTVKMGAKIYGDTTIGPHCKVGGEVTNSVFFGYSNKAHDGFIGNSVIGEWCNLGADTNSSNLKNNYADVKVYGMDHGRYVDSGLQFCGLMMGDHSRCGINTMFNTGTVVGVGCNIFDGGFPPTYIPNFSWGGSGNFQKYKLEKLFETSERIFERRSMAFDDTERKILEHVAENYSR